jgi:Rieske Fe-S protein
MSDERSNEEIEVEEDSNFSRRTFLKFLMGASVVLTVVPLAPMIQFFFTKKPETGDIRKKIANVNDVSPGETHLFFFPGEEDKDRSFLIHLTEEEVAQAEAEGKASFITEGFVALNTICTHLQCPSELPEHEVVVCPCHGAGFNKVDGSVAYGPPPKALPMIKLEVDQSSGDIYATELIGKVGIGRDT